MTDIQKTAKRNSFFVTLAYVGLGTLSLLSMTSKSLMENDFTSILLLGTGILTMPVSFLGFGILWGSGKDGIAIMLVVQLAVFAIFWFASYRYLHNRYTKEQKTGPFKPRR